MRLIALTGTVLSAVGLLYWLSALWRVVRTSSALPRLDRVQDDAPKPWPKVSIIIPACNEGETLEEATASKLAQDYPDFELILINDRSTDGTGEIAARLAARDARLRVLHVAELPEGWLGKVHALHLGTQHARGSWLLYSDADVVLAPDALRQSIAFCEARALDFLTALPHFRSSTFFLDVALAAFVRLACATSRLWSVADPRSQAAAGAGVFNLARRQAFARTSGFEWLRLEVVDDLTLGQMMKRSGARCAVVNAQRSIELHYYRSLWEMTLGVEKSAFAVCGFSWMRLAAACLPLVFLEAAPLLVFWGGLPAPARICAGLSLGAAVAAGALTARLVRGRVLAAVLSPLGSWFLVGMALRSAWLTQRRGGILWRGTLYPTALLRTGRRFDRS